MSESQNEEGSRGVAMLSGIILLSMLGGAATVVAPSAFNNNSNQLAASKLAQTDETRPTIDEILTEKTPEDPGSLEDEHSSKTYADSNGVSREVFYACEQETANSSKISKLEQACEPGFLYIVFERDGVVSVSVTVLNKCSDDVPDSSTKCSLSGDYPEKSCPNNPTEPGVVYHTIQGEKTKRIGSCNEVSTEEGAVDIGKARREGWLELADDSERWESATKRAGLPQDIADAFRKQAVEQASAEEDLGRINAEVAQNDREFETCKKDINCEQSGFSQKEAELALEKKAAEKRLQHLKDNPVSLSGKPLSNDTQTPPQVPPNTLTEEITGFDGDTVGPASTDEGEILATPEAEDLGDDAPEPTEGWWQTNVLDPVTEGAKNAAAEWCNRFGWCESAELRPYDPVTDLPLAVTRNTDVSDCGPSEVDGRCIFVPTAWNDPMDETKSMWNIDSNTPIPPGAITVTPIIDGQPDVEGTMVMKGIETVGDLRRELYYNDAYKDTIVTVNPIFSQILEESQWKTEEVFEIKIIQPEDLPKDVQAVFANLDKNSAPEPGSGDSDSGFVMHSINLRRDEVGSPTTQTPVASSYKPMSQITPEPDTDVQADPEPSTSNPFAENPDLWTSVVEDPHLVERLKELADAKNKTPSPETNPIGELGPDNPSGSLPGREGYMDVTGGNVESYLGPGLLSNAEVIVEGSPEHTKLKSLGVTFLEHESQLYVIKNYPMYSGVPAELAGIKSGDIIFAVDGQDVRNQASRSSPYGYALHISAILGDATGFGDPLEKVGTPVDFLVYREGWSEPRTLTVILDVISEQEQ